jgi:soluble lytic murein transglycosylase-like protein
MSDATLARGLAFPAGNPVQMGLSLPVNAGVRFDEPMSSKKSRALNGALLGAAATALTVKGALAGPLGPAAEGPLNEVKKNLIKAGDAAVAGSTTIIDRAQSKLEDAITGASLLQPTTSATHSAGRGAVARPSIAAAPQVSARPAALDPQAPFRADRTYSRALVRRILRDAAVRHCIDPKLVLALSFWESGWDQSRVSATGAVGIMQVEPDSAQEAGPMLLGRSVDLTDAYDNADVGAAIFREDLDHFKDSAMALAAYYQGRPACSRTACCPIPSNTFRASWTWRRESRAKQSVP